MERLNKWKLSIHARAFRSHFSRTTPKMHHSTTVISQARAPSFPNWNSMIRSPVVLCKLSPSSSYSSINDFSQMSIKRKYHSHNPSVSRAGLKTIHDFIKRLLLRLFIAATVAISGSVIGFFVNHSLTPDKVPYSNRKRTVLMAKMAEINFGETFLEEQKKRYEGKMLPATHPYSVRVCLLAKQIIDALQRDLGKGHISTLTYIGDNNPESESDDWVGFVKLFGFVKVLIKPKPKPKPNGGLNLEIMVIDDPQFQASSLPGAKIIIYTGCVDHLSSDVELATVIALEVGHIVARHHAECMNYEFVNIILRFLGSYPIDVNQNPGRMMMDLEADYIGFLLMASAGYNPHHVVKAYEKMAKIFGEIGCKCYGNPFKERVQQLSRPHIIAKALVIYRKTLSENNKQADMATFE